MFAIPSLLLRRLPEPIQADRKRQADMKKAQLAKEAQLEEGEYEAAVR